MLRSLILATAVALCSLLISCGGGGGSDNDSAGAGNTPPAQNTDQTPNSPSNPNIPATPSSPSGNGSGSSDNPAEPSFQVDATARFSRPGDISADAAGNLYVMDRGNRAIRKISTNGSVSTLPVTAGEGSRIAVDSFGNLIVLSGYTVSSVAPSGTTALLKNYDQGPGSYTPLAVSADSQGRIYVLIRYRNLFRIERIDIDGSARLIYYINNYGNNGGLASDAVGNVATSVIPPLFEAELNDPKYIEYVPLAAQTEEAIHAEGILQWNIDNAYVPGLAVISGALAFDTAGNLYVAGGDYVFDTANSTYILSNIRIARITPAGSVTGIFNGFPSGISNGSTVAMSSFTSIGLAVTADGTVYLSDPFSHAIYRIDSSGQVTLIAGLPNQSGSSD